MIEFNQARAILATILSQLTQIRTSNSVIVFETSYTFQTNAGLNVYEGVSLLDARVDDYPALALNGVIAKPVQATNTPSPTYRVQLTIEGADKVGNNSPLDKAGKLLQDIVAALDLEIGAAEHSWPIIPGQWQIKPTPAGSDMVLVEFRAEIDYIEHFRQTF